MHQAGVRDLLVKFPTLTALRAAGKARISRTVKARSPRLAVKIVDAVMGALDAQTVTVPILAILHTQQPYRADHTQPEIPQAG